MNRALFALLLVAVVVVAVNANKVPPKPPKCPQNEVWNNCGSCEPSCNDPNPQMCVKSCVARCECKNGLLRDNKTGKCVPPCKCTCCD